MSHKYIMKLHLSESNSRLQRCVRVCIFMALNIVIPILTGAIIYYLIAPDVIFVKQIDSALGIQDHSALILGHSLCVELMRNYLLDMIWGYALVYALFCVMGCNVSQLRKCLVIAILFTCITEISQLTPLVRGTFDLIDIVVESISELSATGIILIYLRRMAIDEESD